MILEIGESSGRIWEYLHENGAATVSEISRSLRRAVQCFIWPLAGWRARISSFLRVKAKLQNSP